DSPDVDVMLEAAKGVTHRQVVEIDLLCRMNAWLHENSRSSWRVAPPVDADGMDEKNRRRGEPAAALSGGRVARAVCSAVLCRDLRHARRITLLRCDVRFGVARGQAGTAGVELAMGLFPGLFFLLLLLR